MTDRERLNVNRIIEAQKWVELEEELLQEEQTEEIAIFLKENEVNFIQAHRTLEGGAMGSVENSIIIHENEEDIVIDIDDDIEKIPVEESNVKFTSIPEKVIRDEYGDILPNEFDTVIVKGSHNGKPYVAFYTDIPGIDGRRIGYIPPNVEKHIQYGKRNHITFWKIQEDGHSVYIGNAHCIE